MTGKLILQRLWSTLVLLSILTATSSAPPGAMAPRPVRPPPRNVYPLDGRPVQPGGRDIDIPRPPGAMIPPRFPPTIESPRIRTWVELDPISGDIWVRTAGRADVRIAPANDDLALATYLGKIAAESHGRSVDMTLSEQGLARLGPLVSEIPPEVDLHVRSVGGQTYRARILRTDPEPRIFVEISPSLLVEASNGQLPPLDLGHAETVNLKPDDVFIMSFFDPSADLASVAALKSAAASRGAFVDAVGIGNLDECFKTREGRIAVAVGHVEAGHIAVRDRGGVVTPIKDLAELRDRARSHGISLIVLGCHAGQNPGTTGPLELVQSIDMAARLTRACRSGNLRSFLEELGSKEEPLVVNRGIVSETELNLQARRSRGTKSANLCLIDTVYVAVPCSGGTERRAHSADSPTLLSEPDPWTLFSPVGLKLIGVGTCLVIAALRKSWGPVGLGVLVAVLPWNVTFFVLAFLAGRWSRPRSAGKVTAS